MQYNFTDLNEQNNIHDGSTLQENQYLIQEEEDDDKKTLRTLQAEVQCELVWERLRSLRKNVFLTSTARRISARCNSLRPSLQILTILSSSLGGLPFPGTPGL
jgi:hypothetical protein